LTTHRGRPSSSATRAAGGGTVDLSTIAERRPLAEITEAFSGARLEEALLEDGRSVIIKYLAPEGTWLTRATDGADRLRLLWESGLLAKVGQVVDHTIIDLFELDGQDVVLMRDARGDLLAPLVPVSRETSRALLERLATMHDAFAGTSMPSLCSIGARYGMFAPSFHATDEGPNRHELAGQIDLGWKLFRQHVDADVVRAVQAVHADPDVIAAPLSKFPTTLLHGDAKLENLGLRDGRLVAIDWGELTGIGPREVEVAWYALKATARTGCRPEELFADYESVSGRPLERAALDLASVGSVAQMGFRFAAGAFDTGVDRRDVARRQLTQWTALARAALDRLGSL
jgi:Phosphotransferase enzyme family